MSLNGLWAFFVVTVAHVPNPVSEEVPEEVKELSRRCKLRIDVDIGPSRFVKFCTGL